MPPAAAVVDKAARQPEVVVVAGVSGCGKSTVARDLTAALGWVMLDGDDYHSESNKKKMSSAQPLTDAERWPWLRALRADAFKHVAGGQRVILACSALRHSYREYLRGQNSADPSDTTRTAEPNAPRVEFVLLDPSVEQLKQRLQGRKGHFMPSTLLASQLATLELGDPHEWLAVIRTTNHGATAADQCSSFGELPGSAALPATIKAQAKVDQACDPKASDAEAGLVSHGVGHVEELLPAIDEAASEPRKVQCEMASRSDKPDCPGATFPATDAIVKHVVELVNARGTGANGAS